MSTKPFNKVFGYLRQAIGLADDAPSDGQLLDRFLVQRDEAAFAALVERYSGLVLGLCRRVAGDQHDAEDAFQAAFLVLARKAGSIQRKESVGSWLYGVAYRIAQKARSQAARRRAREQVGLGPAVRSGDDDEELPPMLSRSKLDQDDNLLSKIGQREVRDLLDEELSRLPARYRSALILCYLEGKTHEEAARELGCPRGSMAKRLAGACDRLRRQLDRRGVKLSATLLGTLLADRTLVAAAPPVLMEATIKAGTVFAAKGSVLGLASTRVLALAEGALRLMLWGQVKQTALVGGVLLVLAVGAGVWAFQAVAGAKPDPELPALTRSAQSGPWSAAATWEGGRVPAAGSRVQVRTGHTIVYDLNQERLIRSIHVAGLLTFARDRDTRLDVGLIKIQPGDDASEDGFDCDAHVPETKAGQPKPALEVGSPLQPIPPKHAALIRLVPVKGLSAESCPAIVCCGGRMDFHGASLSQTWVKLGQTASKGDAVVTLSEPVTGWRIGDRVIVTATQHDRAEGGTRRPGLADRQTYTEERLVRLIDGARITLDRPLGHEHLGSGELRGEVANLSRNVVVESAEPKGVRGHTMYHRHSAGAISYAEFRHLGKEGVLGRYSIHYHLVGDTMRGSYVLGASIWDSGNRWITIHGTNHLIVRDCVGYRSVGHGYFFEDGTEINNVLDRNLAVQAFRGKPLPNQVLPFDKNDGAGFWWANSRNSLTRNVSCENDRYGFRYDAAPGLTLPVAQPDGSKQPVDIRTLPFVRFEDNEAHCDGLYGFNLGEGVKRVGPDHRHPFLIRNFKVWSVHYAFRPETPAVQVENLRIHRCVYGIYHPDYDHHVYRGVSMSDVTSEPVNRGHDDRNVQYGPFTMEDVTLERCGGDALIQLSESAPTGKAEAHFRNVQVRNSLAKSPTVGTQPGSRAKDRDAIIPYYFHDHFGPGRHAKVLTEAAATKVNDGLQYQVTAPFTGREARLAEVAKVPFPKLLDPVDDLPPTTVIIHVQRRGGKVIVRGTTADNGTVTRVLVNGREARATNGTFLDWEVEWEDKAGDLQRLTAHAEDGTGNIEKNPHVLMIDGAR